MSFVSCPVKKSIEVIHFHIKSRDVQDLFFVQVTFEKCTTNFNFENGEAAMKTATTNL